MKKKWHRRTKRGTKEARRIKMATNALKLAMLILVRKTGRLRRVKVTLRKKVLSNQLILKRMMVKSRRKERRLMATVRKVMQRMMERRRRKRRKKRRR